MAVLSSELATKRDRLLARLTELGSCAVAFSGGVDSAVVAKAAQLALGDAAVLVTGTSAALADGELDEAPGVGRADRRSARRDFEPTSSPIPHYVANGPDRCYHCKTELYEQLDELAERLGVAVIVNGANADDLGDYRPGMRAAGEHARAQPARRVRIHARRTCVNWRRTGTCPWPRSLRRPAFRAALPMARKSRPNGCR